jgi:hypothetical protein
MLVPGARIYSADHEIDLTRRHAITPKNKARAGITMR